MNKLFTILLALAISSSVFADTNTVETNKTTVEKKTQVDGVDSKVETTTTEDKVEEKEEEKK